MFKKFLLLFKKKKNKELDFFQLIKAFNHFTQVKDKIFIDKEGKRFILTKYGFYPVEQYNLELVIKDLNNEIFALKKENKTLEKKIDSINSSINAEINKYNTLKKSFDELRLKKDDIKPFKEVNLKYEKLKTLFQDLLNKRHDKNLKIKELKTENLELRKKVTELGKNSPLLFEKYEKLKTLFQDLLNKRHDKKSELKKLRDENLKLRKNPFLDDKNIIFLNSQIIDLKKENKLLDNKIEKLFYEIDRKQDFIETQRKIIEYFKSKEN